MLRASWVEVRPARVEPGLERIKEQRTVLAGDRPDLLGVSVSVDVVDPAEAEIGQDGQVTSDLPGLRR